MKRRLANILCAVSLLMCVAIAVVIIRSYWVAEVYVYDSPSTFGTLVHTRGKLVLKFVQDHHGPVNLNTDSRNFASQNRFARYPFFREFGCSFVLSNGDNAGWMTYAHAPPAEWYAFYDKRAKKKQVYFVLADWIPALLVGVPSVCAPAFLWLRRRSRRERGRCARCGYDLTGNTSGVCRECGTAINPPPATPECGERI